VRDLTIDNVSHYAHAQDMPRKKPSEPTQQCAFRLPVALVHRLDAHAEHLTRSMGGITFARVDAVKMLLTRALEAAEGERGGTEPQRQAAPKRPRATLMEMAIASQTEHRSRRGSR
jgi:hypothetical protein